MEEEEGGGQVRGREGQNVRWVWGGEKGHVAGGKGRGVKRKDKGGKKKKRKTAMGMEKESNTARFPPYT